MQMRSLPLVKISEFPFAIFALVDSGPQVCELYATMNIDNTTQDRAKQQHASSANFKGVIRVVACFHGVT
jgi:hypothetical protein